MNDNYDLDPEKHRATWFALNVMANLLGAEYNLGDMIRKIKEMRDENWQLKKALEDRTASASWPQG